MVGRDARMDAEVFGPIRNLVFILSTAYFEIRLFRRMMAMLDLCSSPVREQLAWRQPRAAQRAPALLGCSAAAAFGCARFVLPLERPVCLQTACAEGPAE